MFSLRLIILFSSFVLVTTLGDLPAKAYDFYGGLVTKATAFGYDTVELEVLESKKLEKKPEKYADAFPVGTKFYGELVEHRGIRRMSKDEIKKFKISQAVLPNGETVELDEIIKIRPTNKLVKTRYGGFFLISETAQILGLTIDALTVGLPVGRGGAALWSMGHYLYESRPGENKWKIGTIGFFRGLFSPLPFMVLKGDPLYIHPGSTILIHKNRDKEYINASLIKRKNDIELEEEFRTNMKLVSVSEAEAV